MISSSQKRHYHWIGYPRIDSRLLLRALIAFNVVLAVYNVITLQANTKNGKSSPCVVVINTSKGQQNNANSDMNGNANPKESVSEEVTSMDNVIELVDQMKLTQSQDNANAINVQKDKTAIWWTTEVRDSYSLIKNYIPSDENVDYNRSVTLTTQGTFEFLYHSVQLCRRWDGPVSIAVYAPGDDLKLAINIIYLLRQCSDSCVKKNISWHMVYDSAFGPDVNAVQFPNSYLENNTFDCSKDTLEGLTNKFATKFRREHSLPYPINVVRNAARLTATTKYVFACDIELYPSINIVSSFMDLIDRENAGSVSLIPAKSPHVYVIPIFEVKAGVEPPLTKQELRELVSSRKAIFFHKYVCDVCQRFPDRDKWLHVNSSDGTLNVFRVTKRTKATSSWEPLFIGTNAEPLYDEQLTWDGKMDKMTQMVEMCLMGYNLIILDNAFLVHAPGIKHIDMKQERRRAPFIEKNRAVYLRTLVKLKKKFVNKYNC